MSLAVLSVKFEESTRARASGLPARYRPPPLVPLFIRKVLPATYTRSHVSHLQHQQVSHPEHSQARNLIKAVHTRCQARFGVDTLGAAAGSEPNIEVFSGKRAYCTAPPAPALAVLSKKEVLWADRDSQAWQATAPPPPGALLRENDEPWQRHPQV